MLDEFVVHVRHQLIVLSTMYYVCKNVQNVCVVKQLIKLLVVEKKHKNCHILTKHCKINNVR